MDGHTAHHNSRTKVEPYPGSRPVGAFPVSLQRLSRDVRHEALHCSTDSPGGQRSGADCACRECFVEIMSMLAYVISKVFLTPYPDFSIFVFWVSHKGCMRAHTLVLSDFRNVYYVSHKVHFLNPISSDFSELFFSKPHIPPIPILSTEV